MKKSTKNIKPRMLTAKECSILIFLWRWKVATILTLKEEFASKASFWNFYHLLKDLQKDGYLEIRYGATSTNKKFALWHLSDFGFNYVKDELGELDDITFASTSLFHDSYVTAFHYGNWIYRKPENVDLFTEQELKCSVGNSYPYWVPNTKVHRPDGYTRIKVGTKNCIVAVEVELSLKTQERYQAVGDFYDDRKNISHILWLVSSKSMMDSIQNAMIERRSKRIHDHHFVLLNDFDKNFWEAKLIDNKNQLTVSQFYDQFMDNNSTNNSVITRSINPVTLFLKPIQSPVGLHT